MCPRPRRPRATVPEFPSDPVVARRLPGHCRRRRSAVSFRPRRDVFSWPRCAQHVVAVLPRMTTAARAWRRGQCVSASLSRGGLDGLNGGRCDTRLRVLRVVMRGRVAASWPLATPAYRGGDGAGRGVLEPAPGGPCRAPGSGGGGVGVRRGVAVGSAGSSGGSSASSALRAYAEVFVEEAGGHSKSQEGLALAVGMPTGRLWRSAAPSRPRARRGGRGSAGSCRRSVD